MKVYTVSFRGLHNHLGYWTVSKYSDIKEVNDYIYDVLTMSKDGEYLKIDKGGIKTGHIVSWEVIEN